MSQESFPLIWKNCIEEPAAERALRYLLFGLVLVGRLLGNHLTPLQVHGDDGVQLPLQESDAAEARPLPYCLKSQGIRPEAVAGALAIKLAKPVPNLLTGDRNGNLLAAVLIFNQSAEAGDELLVKELRRTALTSTCSRMIRNLE